MPLAKRFVFVMFSIIILFSLVLLTGCGSEEATPTPQPPSPTAEPEPATEEPATSTATNEPATATAVPATGTPEPTQIPEPISSATFETADCEFDVPASSDVTCGWLTVPEDRNNPDDDSTIQLHVAIFASQSDNPAPDPIIYLEGGPGGEPLEALPFTFDRLFAPYTANRDLIIFDQRGTGYSQPSLACPEQRELMFELIEQDIPVEEEVALSKESLAECRDRLVDEGVNLAAYNSAANAADLNDLRQALGYDEWNVWGISYGTRLAQTVMRDHPEGIRSVILDSTYPLESNLITETPDNLARAFNVFFEGCAADPACNKAYPDLETRFYDLVAQLNEENIELTLTDLFSGETYNTLFDGDDLTGILFQSLYSTEIIPGLPKLITDVEAGDTSTLSALLSSFLINGEFISIGMQFSVQCHEENIFASIEEVTEAAEKYPELANLFTNSINLGPPALEICDMWGAGTADAIENEPITSDIPTLVLAGEYDPITPPVWGEEVASNLSQSTYFEFPGTGHGASVAGECAVELVESFLANPNAKPDASCLAELSGPVFTVPSGEADVTLIPYESDVFGISGLVPEGWEEITPGGYLRGQSALDQTLVLQQAAPGTGADELLSLLSTQFGWANVPESSGSYESENGTWTLYDAEVQGLPTTLALREENGTALLVLLLSSGEERDQLTEDVFLPALEALVLN